MSGEITVEAIVLRRRDSGETDRRLTILTREKGKFDVVAKGARKGGSRLASSSDPLCAVRFGLAHARRNYYITQAQPLSSFRGLRTDFDRLIHGIALAELYGAVIPYDEPAEEAFELLVTSLALLEAHPKAVVATVWAQVRLLSLSGFLPSFDVSAVTGERIKEANAFVSPFAGGYVGDAEAIEFSDRFRVRAEALYGLARIADLSQPPENLKFAEEALRALFPFWRHIADSQLPANETAIQSL